MQYLIGLLLYEVTHLRMTVAESVHTESRIEIEIFVAFDGGGLTTNRVYVGFSILISKHVVWDVQYFWQASREGSKLEGDKHVIGTFFNFLF